MEPESYIINQLREQKIEFNLLQSKYVPDVDSLLSKVIEKWKNKFVADRKAPNLDYYLWHIFSFGATVSIQGEAAEEEYLNQWKTNVLIFNEQQQYLIECIDAIPKIEVENFFDDIYISHSNMKWTYVIPHEVPEMGPYFSVGEPGI